MENLQELLVEELKDLYSAEKQIVKALPKIIRGAASEELKAAITEHLEVTKAQVTRLEEVFGQLEEKPKAKHCKGMEGLLKEGAECLEEEDKGALRDLQLIGAGQRVEHYEVAAYGTAKAMAEKLGLSDAVELLNETLEEEEKADKKLTESHKASTRKFRPVRNKRARRRILRRALRVEAQARRRAQALRRRVLGNESYERAAPEQPARLSAYVSWIGVLIFAEPPT